MYMYMYCMVTKHNRHLPTQVQKFTKQEPQAKISGWKFSVKISGRVVHAWCLNQGILSEDYGYVMEQRNENSLTTFSNLLKDSEVAPKMATSFTPQSS